MSIIKRCIKCGTIIYLGLLCGMCGQDRVIEEMSKTMKNRCATCDRPILNAKGICAWCNSKGRIPPPIDVQTQAQKFGTDQDPAIKVSRQTMPTGQAVIVVSYNGVSMILPMRSAIDLMHKLGKTTVDMLTDAMLLFMKD